MDNGERLEIVFKPLAKEFLPEIGRQVLLSLIERENAIERCQRSESFDATFLTAKADDSWMSAADDDEKQQQHHHPNQLSTSRQVVEVDFKEKIDITPRLEYSYQEIDKEKETNKAPEAVAKPNIVEVLKPATTSNLQLEQDSQYGHSKTPAKPLRNFSSLCPDGVFDSHFEIGLAEPKISHDVYETLTKGMQKIRITAIVNGQAVPSSNWFTMGVVVFQKKQSTVNGNQYCTWHLSDLKHRQSITVNVFGKCCDQHGSISLGNVILLLNPIVAKENVYDNLKRTVVKVDRLDSVVELGVCPDFGICKATVAKTGKQCTNVVNVKEFECCEYHLSSALKKYSSNRAELQSSPSLPIDINSLNSKALFFEHKPIGVKASTMKHRKVKITELKAALNSKQKSGKKSASWLHSVTIPSTGSRNILKAIGLSPPKCSLSSKKDEESRGMSMMGYKELMRSSTHTSSKKSLSLRIPKLARGSKNGMLELGDKVISKKKISFKSVKKLPSKNRTFKSTDQSEIEAMKDGTDIQKNP